MLQMLLGASLLPGKNLDDTLDICSDLSRAISRLSLVDSHDALLLGPINPTGITFVSELGRILTDSRGDPRETSYLCQRVSPAVQCYNSVAFRGTFSVPTELD